MLAKKVQYVLYWAVGGIVLAVSGAALMTAHDLSDHHGELVDRIRNIEASLAKMNSIDKLPILQADVAALQVQVGSLFDQMTDLRARISELSAHQENVGVGEEAQDTVELAQLEYPLSTFRDLPSEDQARVNQAANLYLRVSDTEIVELHFSKPGNDTAIKASELPLLEELMWAYVPVYQSSMEEFEEKVRNLEYELFDTPKDASSYKTRLCDEQKLRPDAVLLKWLPDGRCGVVQLSSEVHEMLREFGALQHDTMKRLGAINLGFSVTKGAK